MELSPRQEDRLRMVFKVFNRFMLLLWRLGLGAWGNGTKYGGYMMVIKHIGRKSSLTRYTPVNYAIINDDIYCTAGFGKKSDWYLNILHNPEVEVWLPDGRWVGMAKDVTTSEDRAKILRAVIVASGFAGLLFGVNPKKLTDDDFEELLDRYRIIRIRRKEPVTGPGGPGELAWIWPVSTFILILLLRRKC